MRVALVNYNYSESLGGVERYVTNLARGLAARGHDVHVVSARGWPRGEGPAPTMHHVPVTRWYSPLRYASFARNAAAFLAENTFDIVHGFGRTYRQDILRVGGGVHWEYLLNTDASLRSAFGRWLRRMNPRDRAIMDLERRGFAPGAYRRIVCVSHRCREEVQRYYGVPDDAVTVIHNGVDLAKFCPAGRPEARQRIRERFGFSAGDRLALFAGTGFARKGLRYAIETMALLPRESGWRLLVVGRGDAALYRRGAYKLKLRERVLFLGARDDIAEFYRASDALVLPSFYDPFPNVCLEAMACGLPVVTTRITGVAEIIGHGTDSFVVEDGHDAMAIADCLRRLGDPALRETVGMAARAKAERHSVDANIERNLELYREVAALKEQGAVAR